MSRYATIDLPLPYQLARRRAPTSRRGRVWYLQHFDAGADCWRDVAGPYTDSISAVRRYDALTRAGAGAGAGAGDITTGDITTGDITTGDITTGDITQADQLDG